MSNIIDSILGIIGVKAKDVSLDAQKSVADTISAQAIGLFEAAANGLDHAAEIKLHLVDKYDDLIVDLAREQIAAEQAALDLHDSAVVDQTRADRLRDLFGLVAA